jgi:hypothetical protein
MRMETGDLRVARFSVNFSYVWELGKRCGAEPGRAASRYNLVCGYIALRFLKMVST